MKKILNKILFEIILYAIISQMIISCNLKISKRKLSESTLGPVGWNLTYLTSCCDKKSKNYYYDRSKSQSGLKVNLTVTNKTQTGPDGRKNDLMSFPYYFWHPNSILNFTKGCANCNATWNKFLSNQTKYSDLTETSKDNDVKKFYQTCYPPSTNITTSLKARAVQGMPDFFIWCDGYGNQEAMDAFPNQSIKKIVEYTRTMVLGWFIGDKNDSDGIQEEIARTLNYFFVNNDTMMNPNAKFAEFRNFDLAWGKNYSEITIGNKSESLGGGIISLKQFYLLIDSLLLLETAQVKPVVTTMIQSLRNWFTQLQNWYDTSVQGAFAAKQRNNIGTYYYAQYCAVAYFTGNNISKAKSYISNYFNVNNNGPNYHEQFDSNCTQVLEVIRGFSLAYQVDNLHALYIIGGYADRWNMSFDGKSFWNWKRTNDSASCLSVALDKLVKIYGKKTSSNSKDDSDILNLARLLIKYDNKYPDKEYNLTAQNIVLDYYGNESATLEWMKYSDNKFPN